MWLLGVLAGMPVTHRGCFATFLGSIDVLSVLRIRIIRISRLAGLVDCFLEAHQTQRKSESASSKSVIRGCDMSSPMGAMSVQYPQISFACVASLNLDMGSSDGGIVGARRWAVITTLPSGQALLKW